MVYIYTTCCNSDHLLNEFSDRLPAAIMQKAGTFKFKEDYMRYVLGKILLIHGVDRLGYTHLTLEHLLIDEYNKPFFPGNISFNISHSGKYVLCAVSKNCKVGVDIEEIKSIDTTEFLHCFTSREWWHINSSEHPQKTFYQFWTRKEAIIKADGKGLQIPLLNFEVIDAPVKIGPDKWYVSELPMEAGYAAHLASDVDAVEYVTQSIA